MVQQKSTEKLSNWHVLIICPYSLWFFHVFLDVVCWKRKTMLNYVALMIDNRIGIDHILRWNSEHIFWIWTFVEMMETLSSHHLTYQLQGYNVPLPLFIQCTLIIHFMIVETILSIILSVFTVLLHLANQPWGYNVRLSPFIQYILVMHIMLVETILRIIL